MQLANVLFPTPEFPINILYLSLVNGLSDSSFSKRAGGLGLRNGDYASPSYNHLQNI